MEGESQWWERVSGMGKSVAGETRVSGGEVSGGGESVMGRQWWGRVSDGKAVVGESPWQGRASGGESP